MTEQRKNQSVKDGAPGTPGYVPEYGPQYKNNPVPDYGVPGGPPTAGRNLGPTEWPVVGEAHPELRVTHDGDRYATCDTEGRLVEYTKFQSGPLKEAGGNNGVSVESLLVIIMHRLEQYQVGEYACDENAQALRKLDSAIDALDARTAERKSRGVEGTNVK